MEANATVVTSTPSPTVEQLLAIAIDSILEKKGQNIVSLDLRNLDDAMSDYFIICEGSSPPQIKAIADSVSDTIKKTYGEAPTYKEGFKSMEWVLLDYIDIVVHVFHTNKRFLYNLEELWGDAGIITEYDDRGKVIHR
ncbi:MAG: ribosome silencing factor [Chitinophagales bacterium]